MTQTATTTKTRPSSRPLRRALKVAAGILSGATVWFVCCVLPILLVGGGTAAVTDGIVRESLIMVPIGLLLAGAGLAYILIRRARSRRRAETR